MVYPSGDPPLLLIRPRLVTWREWTAVIGWGRFVRPSKARQVASRCQPASSSPAGCCCSSMAAAAMGVAVRRLHAAAQPPRLTKLALHPPKSVEVEFTDDSSFHLSAEFLRVYSPAADSKIRSIAGEKVIFGRRHVGIMSAESVGNYGVRILFDDLHKTGIFTWDYLHHLGSNKFSLMRNYIRTLKKHGLSRDPRGRK